MTNETKYLDAAMDNVFAWKIGEACNMAAQGRAGDFIDRGLILMRLLRENGFGLVPLTPVPPAAPARAKSRFHPEREPLGYYLQQLASASEAEDRPAAPARVEEPEIEQIVRTRVGRYRAALEQSRKFMSHADPCFQRSGKPCSCGFDAHAAKVGQLLADKSTRAEEPTDPRIAHDFEPSHRNNAVCLVCGQHPSSVRHWWIAAVSPAPSPAPERDTPWRLDLMSGKDYRILDRNKMAVAEWLDREVAERIVAAVNREAEHDALLQSFLASRSGE